MTPDRNPPSTTPAGKGASPLRRAIAAPWLASNELRRRLILPYVRLLFAVYGIRWGRGWRILGVPIIQRYRGSRIELGDGLVLRSNRSSNPLAPNHPVVLATRNAGAVIRIGAGCGLTGATLVAAECIDIGQRVVVGANVTIVDTDFHPLDPAERERDMLAGEHRPVRIEDDVFIGMNSIILKGVTIGRGSVIGAGSVVTRDIPADSVAAGNPAGVIRPVHE